MMMKRTLLFRETLPISLIPLITAGVSFLAEKLLYFMSNTQVNDQSGIDTLQDPSQKASENNLLVMSMLSLQQLRAFLMSVYDNYIVFLVMTMVLHLTVHHFKDLVKKVSKKNSQKMESSVSPRITARNILSFVINYTICFYFFKLLVFAITMYFGSGETSLTPMINSNEWANQQQQRTIMTVPMPKTNQELFQNFHDNRLMRGRMLASQKPLFLKVINEVYMDELFPLHTVFSNDFQTAFEVQVNGIGVYNISDPIAPKTLSVFQTTFVYFPSAVLSSKSKTLFLDADNLQIVNVTNLKSPKLLSKVAFRTDQELKAYTFRYHPTVAVSSDEKFIIYSDPRMNIYDTSNLKAPQLVFSQTWKATAVLLSKDDRTAFIGSDGSLQILDVTDFKAPKQISSAPIIGVVLTSALSSDEQTIYLISSMPSQDELSVMRILNIVNIADIKNPIVLKKIALGTTTDVVLTSLTVSSDGTYLVLKSSQSLKIINLRDYQIIDLMDDALHYPTMAFLPNGNNAVIFSVGMVRFTEVYFNIPYDQSSCLQPNYLAQLPWQGFGPKQVAFMKGSRTVLILGNNPEDLNHKMLVSINLQDDFLPVVSQVFQLESSGLFTLSVEGKNIYYKSKEKTLEILTPQGEKSFIAFQEDFEQMFVVSPDDKTLFSLLLNDTDSSSKISITDVSDHTSAKLLSSLSIQSNSPRDYFEAGSTYMILSPDEKTLFYLDNKLYIIDVSDKTAPKLVTDFQLGKYLTKTFTFSSDFKTCYVMAAPFLNKKLLLTIDVRDLRNPVILSTIDLPVDSNYKLSVSSDDKQLFVSTSEAFITLDISDKKAIKISEAQLIKVSSFTPVFGDQQILIVNENGFHVINRKAKYALYLGGHQFSLGKTYSNSLKILELNHYNNNYSSIGQNYKFIQASLYVPEIKPLNKFIISYPILPSWIYFDKETAVLDVDLTHAVDVSSYQIRFRASTEVPASAFLQITAANYTQVEAENLQAYLVGQGYLDSEEFLTPNFDENTPLKLNSLYSPYEKDIRQILKSHSIELITRIGIESSLNLIQSQPFRVITPSLDSITVTIKLDPKPNQTRFVTKAYSAVKVNLNEEKTLLILEGALLNINEALKELLINIEDGDGSCEGSITVSDKLNPVISYYFDNLSDYIKTNKQPLMTPHYSIQDQVNKVAIIAGEHFNIEFDELTFSDLNNRTLIYALEMPERNMEVPSWITLRGRTLMGTPPEEFWAYKKEFCMKASNEYKSVSVIFRLEIGLSYVTLMRRVLFVMGYLFTAYKSWQYSDRFYNILCKRRYRYLKTIKVIPGKKLSENTILPIMLISKETQSLSKTILREIKVNLGHGKSLSDAQLIEGLVDSRGDGSLNQQKLREAIENVNVCSDKECVSNELVHQLIANELTMKRLGFSDEKKTLEIFEKIKSKWIDLVDVDHQGGFIIKNKSLAKEFQNDDGDETQEDSGSSTKRSIEKELILSPISLHQINIGLLKDAILAYAFENQNLYTNRYLINIQSKELLRGVSMRSWTRRFLKLDMIDLVQHSQKQLGYGLKYKLFANKIVFYGKTEEEISNRTVVVQIVSIKGWILREFLVQGLEGESFLEHVEEEL